MSLMYTFVFFCYILSNWAAEVLFYPFCRNSQNVICLVNIDIPVRQYWLPSPQITFHHIDCSHLSKYPLIPTVFYPTVLITEEYTLQQMSL